MCIFFNRIYHILIFACLHWTYDHIYVLHFYIPNATEFRETSTVVLTNVIWSETSIRKASDAELWYFLWCAPLINGWANNREAGDFRRHRAHYDVMVENMSDFAVIRVSADGLAPLGAGASAYTLMTKFVSHLYTRLALFVFRHNVLFGCKSKTANSYISFNCKTNRLGIPQLQFTKPSK